MRQIGFCNALQQRSLQVIAYLLLLAFPVAMAFAAANDLFTMTIPNKISLILIATFAAAALDTGMPWQDALTHVGVGFAALIVGFVLFSLRLVGGGDAKLMAAGALWMGFDFVLPYVVYITVFGGVLSLAILAYRRFVPAQKFALPGWALRLHENGSGIPYGIAIAAAALAIYPSTVWFQHIAA